jgi:hypothetical protein
MVDIDVLIGCFSVCVRGGGSKRCYAGCSDLLGFRTSYLLYLHLRFHHLYEIKERLVMCFFSREVECGGMIFPEADVVCPLFAH